MKACPLCGGPAPDRPGFPGALPCDRCAGSIDVSRALEAAGPLPRRRVRLPRGWIAAAAAMLLAAAVAAALLTTGEERPREGPDRPGAAAMVAEARRRLEALAPPALPTLKAWGEIEQLLREAEALDPGRAETHLLLGGLQLARGAEGPTLAAFDAALAIEPANLQALGGRGERVLSSRLLLHLDRLRWPELSRALGARLADAQGPAFDLLAARQEPGSPGEAFARAYAAVARADWAAARRTLDAFPRDGLPPRVKDELAYTSFVVGYLSDPGRPAVGEWAGLIRGEEGAAAGVGEREVWLLLVRHLERKAFLPRLPVSRNPRHPLHAGLLRAEAALHEAKGDARTAAAALGEAVASAPDYLQARLARASALSKLGEAAEARRETEAALRLARAWGLSPGALREITGE